MGRSAAEYRFSGPLRRYSARDRSARTLETNGLSPYLAPYSAFSAPLPRQTFSYTPRETLVRIPIAMHFLRKSEVA